jgi:endonuclease YncB( thermonuclease family)
MNIFSCCIPIFTKREIDSPMLPHTEPIKWEDTIPFVVPVTNAEVIKVYDGDTITIATKLPFKNSPLYRFQVRLNGIDCPEIKGSCEEEKSLAREVRDKLSELLLHKQVILANVGTEKYGRLLADVFLDQLHINKWLLDNRYAVEYDGGTKKIPTSWLKYHLTGEHN